MYYGILTRPTVERIYDFVVYDLSIHSLTLLTYHPDKLPSKLCAYLDEPFRVWVLRDGAIDYGSATLLNSGTSIPFYTVGKFSRK